MEAYLKIFMRQILEHKENLNEYVNKLYEDESQKENLNVFLIIFMEITEHMKFS